MNQDSNTYSFLLSKLDQFIRKFYLNQLLRGAIYFAAILLVSVLLFSSIEYFVQAGVLARTTMFWTFVLMNLGLFIALVVMPLLKIYSLGKRISNHQAATIIGVHFPEVKDKLLNTLQLHEGMGQGSKELIEASISQKVAALKPVPFTMAVNLKENKKYLKYALIPLLIILFLIIKLPDVILDSSARIMSYNQEFVPMAPFSFKLKNKKLEVLTHSDFTINLEIEGNEVPAEAYIELDGKIFRMITDKPGEFKYNLRNLTANTTFKFSAAGFNSVNYQIKVLPKPLLKSFTVELEYPTYTGKKNETIANIGDLNVPEGTVAKWRFNAESTESVEFNFDQKKLIAERNGKDKFSLRRDLLKSEAYYIKPINPFVQKPDSMLYSISVQKDDFPGIMVQQKQDSNNLKSYFFNGELNDDYGISALTFNYKFTKSQNKEKLKENYTRQSIGVSKKSTQAFFHFWDLNTIGFQAGDELSYYFEVWDNDAVNGRKSSKSQRFTIKAPTKNEIKKMVSEQSDELKNDMQSLIRQAAEVQKELEDTKNKLLQKDQLNWEDKEAVKKMLEKQKNLQEQVKDLNQKYNQMKQQQDEFNQMDPELAEKYEKVMELFEKLMTDEMKEKYEELEKLMNENLDKLRDELDDMKLDNKELEKELDVALEQFKRMELEQKMEEALDELKELAQKQEELAEKTENKEAKAEELAKEQEQLNKEFEKLQEDLKDIDKKNSELESPLDLDKQDEESEEIKEDMENSSKELKDSKEDKAAKHQKSAAKKMKKMQEEMEKSMASAKKKSLELDYAAIRQLLENLLYLSFEEEKVINELGEVRSYNPKFVELAQRQIKLKADAELIEDSLTALSKRVIQLSGFINKEMSQVNYNMDKTMKFLSERNIAQSRNYQQYVMTHVNNLAVMLSEVMEQMQQEMGESKPGDQNCSNPKKPGKGKGKKPKDQLGDMSEMQKKLNQQLGEMKKKMQNGQAPLSKELAKTAAQQQALRRELQKLNEMKQQAGEKPSNELKEIEELMDKTEKDLVNKQINTETLKRQQEILNKLLEAEKAEREQEYDDKRKSETAEQKNATVNKAFEEYKRKKLKEIELLNSLPPQLNPYYKGKVKQYYKLVD